MSSFKLGQIGIASKDFYQEDRNDHTAIITIIQNPSEFLKFTNGCFTIKAF